jgi:hypothetical protein
LAAMGEEKKLSISEQLLRMVFQLFVGKKEIKIFLKIL